jgi:hypothetical protein
MSRLSGSRTAAGASPGNRRRSPPPATRDPRPATRDSLALASHTSRGPLYSRPVPGSRPIPVTQCGIRVAITTPMPHWVRRVICSLWREMRKLFMVRGRFGAALDLICIPHRGYHGARLPRGSRISRRCAAEGGGGLAGRRWRLGLGRSWRRRRRGGCRGRLGRRRSGRLARCLGATPG